MQRSIHALLVGTAVVPDILTTSAKVLAPQASMAMAPGTPPVNVKGLELLGDMAVASGTLTPSAKGLVLLATTAQQDQMVQYLGMAESMFLV